MKMYKQFFKIGIYVFAIIGFVLTAGYTAVRFGLTNTHGIVDLQRESFLANAETATTSPETRNLYWNTAPEWATLRDAILKDESVIKRAASASGVPARLIVANLIVEQLRFFYDDRESYKKFFEPLKILGSQTQFSWGVMGIKEETAIAVENNLKDKTSPFYLGSQYENLLAFKTDNAKQERFTRMTDQHDHYWSYLYAGLYFHEIETQWSRAGFDISSRPEILSTLFNIGFANSHPHADPLSGGAVIPIGNRIYSFGSLAGEFYYSSELINEFPR